MTGFSKAKVALLAFMSAGAAYAQSAPPAGPVTLVPPTAAAPSAAPSGAIEIGALAELGLDRVGLADIVSEPLAEDVWSASDPEFVKSALARLPRKLDSIALRTLALRLLLPPSLTPRAPESVAISLEPADAAAPEIQPVGDPWLFRARIEALARLGDWTDAARLIDLAPRDKIDPALRRLRVDAMLVAGEIDNACTETQAELSSAPDSHWQKLQVFCQFHAKQTSAAQLGLSLLREQGDEDPAFFWAADLLQGERPLTPNGVQRLDPVVLAMLRLANRAVPDAVLRDGDPTALRFAALMEPQPPTDEEKLTESERADRIRLLQGARIVLAERALALGALAAEDVAKLYLAVDFSGEVKPPQLTQVTADDPRGRAFMYQLARAQTVPTARAEVIARAVDLARADRGAKGPTLQTVALSYADLLAEIAPMPDLIWFAGHALRLSTAAGQGAAARPWIELVEQMSRTNIEAGEIADSLWPVRHLSGGLTPATPQDLRAWQATQPVSGALGQREVVLNTLEALGEPVSAADWLPVLVAGSRAVSDPHPSVAVWNGLAEAARNGRAGDAVALALIAAGDQGLDKLSPLTQARMIQSLMVAGRTTDARALAVEAVLAAGL